MTKAGTAFCNKKYKTLKFWTFAGYCHLFLLLVLFLCLVDVHLTYGQTNNVGIGTLNPNNSAILELADTTRGLLIPRMTSAQLALISTPSTGLIVYQTDGLSGFYYYTGTVWLRIAASSSTGDLDMNNHLILNIGNAGTDFLSSGGLNLANILTVATGGITVTAGGINVTGNSTIAGTLGGITGLTVASGGASITGNSTITGTLGGITGLTVVSGGANISGASTINGTLGGLTGLTVSSGTTSITGTITLPSLTASQFIKTDPSKNLTTGTLAVSDLPLTLGKMYIGNASNLASELVISSGQLIVGSGSNQVAAVTLSGDASIVAGGALTVTGLRGRVLSTTAPTDGQVLKWNNTSSQWEPGSASFTSPLPIANGGTNSTTTPTTGGVIYFDGTRFNSTAAGLSGQVLRSNGASAPDWVTPSTGGGGGIKGRGSANHIAYWVSLDSLDYNNFLSWDGSKLETSNIVVDNNLTISTLNASSLVKTNASKQLISVANLDLSSSDFSGLLPIAKGGTNSSTALLNNRLMTSSGGAIVELADPTGTNYILKNSTGGTPAWVDPATFLTGSYWSLTGNSGINQSANFIGTSDNKDLNFRTNNTMRMYIKSNGNLYIDSTTLYFTYYTGTTPNYLTSISAISAVFGGSVTANGNLLIASTPSLANSLQFQGTSGHTISFNPGYDSVNAAYTLPQNLPLASSLGLLTSNHGGVMSWANLGSTATNNLLKYDGTTITSSNFFDKTDSIGIATAASGTLFKVHTNTGSEGIVDLKHQSRVRYYLTGDQTLANLNSWEIIPLNGQSFDEKSEFSNSTYTFTAKEDGYYQVNARTEVTVDAEPNANSYVSIGIFLNGIEFALGNRLQLETNTIDPNKFSLQNNNAPIVSDIIKLVSGDHVTIRVYYSNSGTLRTVTIKSGSSKTYVSIHKLS